MYLGLKYKIRTDVSKRNLPHGGINKKAMSGFSRFIAQWLHSPQELNYEPCVDIRSLSRTNQSAEYFFRLYSKSRVQSSGI